MTPEESLDRIAINHVLKISRESLADHHDTQLREVVQILCWERDLPEIDKLMDSESTR